MSVKIIGIKKQPSKNNPSRVGCTVYFTQPFDDYSLKNAEELKGIMCGFEFTYEDIDVTPGDEVELLYKKGFQGTAVLSGVTKVKPAAPAAK